MEGKRGYSMVELLLVMLLLCMFGLTVAALTQSGTSAYKAIQDNMDKEADARAALTYVTVRLKQNDAPGMVEVGSAYNAPALVINEGFGGVQYCTWIFFINGELREAPYLDEGEQPSPANSELIAYVEGFDARYDAASRMIKLGVTYEREREGASEVMSFDGAVHLRSGDNYAPE